MHDPEGYYPRRFLNDFETFWQALEKSGSISPGRVEGGAEFAAEDFAVRQDGTDLLEKVHKARRVPFMYGMLFSVLLDQLLYTHFGAMYGTWKVSLFQQDHRLGLFQHPKLSWDRGDGERAEMERPWLLFSSANLKSRDWKETDVVAAFRPFASSMVNLWGGLIERGALPGVTWAAISQAMQQDAHVSASPFGRIIQELAQAWQWSRHHAA
jgi:hypothetical protein